MAGKDKAGYNLESQEIQLDKDNEKLYERINSITSTCSKPYFYKILGTLADKNAENARIIYDYIIAEQTELNIKNSTKEAKIKSQFPDRSNKLVRVNNR